MLQRRRHSYQHLVSIKYFSQQLQKYHTLWVFSRASSGPTTPRVSERSSSQPPVRLFSPDTSTFDPAWPPTAGRSFIWKGNHLIWNYRKKCFLFFFQCFSLHDVMSFNIRDVFWLQVCLTCVDPTDSSGLWWSAMKNAASVWSCCCFQVTRLKGRTLVFTLQNISEADSGWGLDLDTEPWSDPPPVLFKLKEDHDQYYWSGSCSEV